MSSHGAGGRKPEYFRPVERHLGLLALLVLLGFVFALLGLAGVGRFG